MSYHNGGNSGFGLYQGQPGNSYGPGMVGTVVDDHRSVHSTDSNGNRRVPSVGYSVPGAITPAQAYARSVKTGEPCERSLYHTIERAQVERKSEPQVTALHPNTLGAGRGASFAQHLYASSFKNQPGSSVPALGSIPILPSNEAATSFSHFSGTGAGQGSRSVPNRNTSILTSSFDSSQVPESFSPSDLYNSSVAKRGLQSRNSTMPDASSARPLSLMPGSDTASLVSRHNVCPQSRGSYNQSQQGHLDAHNFRSASYQPPIQLPSSPPVVELQVNGSSTVNPSSSIEPRPVVPRIVSLSRNPDDTISSPSPPPPFVEQSVEIPRGSSPPPFEENERPAIPAEVIVDVPTVSAAVSQENQLESSLVPPPDAAHELVHDVVPAYTLVDEEQPPPAFDDLHPASNTETSTETARPPQPEVLPVPSQVVAGQSSSSSPPPSVNLPPFVSNSKTYPPEKAPAYTLLNSDSASSFVGTSQSTNQGTTMQMPSIATDHTSNLPRPDPPSMRSTNFQMLDQSPPMSPLASPVNTPPLHGGGFSFARPPVPSSPRPASVLSARSVESQPTRFSYDHFAFPSKADNMPPAVVYHNKPTAQQAKQTTMPSATQSLARPLGTQESPDINTLTDSMSRLMEGSSPSDTRSLAHESGSPTRQSTHGLSGNQQVLPASHPPYAPRTTNSLDRETYGPGADRLLQEAYQLAQSGSDGEARPGIQGSGLGSLSESHQGHPGFIQTSNPHTMNHPTATRSRSSQHSPDTVPHLGPVPPRYSQDVPQTEPVPTTEVGSMFLQLGGTAVPPSTRPPYSDRPYTASVPPSLQSSHYSINRDVHRPVVTSGSVPFQPENFHPQQYSLLANSDPMRGGHVSPPPFPPPIVAQTPQASRYSQANMKYQVSPGTRAPILNSNDLARQFARDALLASAGPHAYAFHGTTQR